MNQSLFNRLLRLSSRTRDKIVFVDPETGRASVIMSLGAYETLLDHADDSDEIEDIDIPEFDEDDETLDESDDHDDLWQPSDINQATTPEIIKDTPAWFEPQKEKVPSAAESALEDEEKFYLEPLE